MTVDERNQISNALKTAIRQEGGSVPLSAIRKVLIEKNVPESLVSQIESPKQWIPTACPEILIVGTNGKELLCISDSVLRALSTAALQSQDGYVPTPRVRRLLRQANVDVDGITNGEKLTDYLQRTYPFIIFNDTKQRITFPGVAESSTGPQNRTLLVPQVQIGTRNFSNSLCYFAVPLSMVKEVASNPELSNAFWNNYRVNAFAKSFLGVEGHILCATEGRIPRIAIPVGLKSKTNQDLYLICSKNEYDPNKQRWMCNIIASPDQDSPEGEWLTNSFDISTSQAEKKPAVSRVSALRKAIDDLKDVREDLKKQTENVNNLIADGRPVAGQFLKLAQQYNQRWTEVSKIALEIDPSIDSATFNIEAAETIVLTWGQPIQVRSHIIKLFQELSEGAWAFMEESGLSPQNLADKDVTKTEILLDRYMDGDSASALDDEIDDLLAPFEAINTLRSFNGDVLGEDELEAIFALNAHFQSRLTPNKKILNVTFLSQAEEAFSFLDNISEIRALVEEFTTTETKTATPTQPKPSISKEELLKLTLNGNPLQYIYSVFSEPNELESAIMAADFDKVKEIIEDEGAMHRAGYSNDDIQTARSAFVIAFAGAYISPGEAAKRLQSILPNSKQIEKCLLLSLYAAELGAANALLQFYLNKNWLSLAKILLSNSKETEFDKDLLSQCVLSLLKNNQITLRQAAEQYILILLSSEGIEAVQQCEEETGLKGQILRIYDQTRPVLINYLVFQSRDLNSYIISPENAEEIAAYGIDVAAGEFAEHLKANDYNRGDKPENISSRLLTFIGNWGGLAQSFAELASEGAGRQHALFNVAINTGDTERAKTLLQESEDLREANIGLYLDMLYQNEDYSAFCKFYEEHENNGGIKEAVRYVLAILKGEQDTEKAVAFVNADFVNDKEMLLKISEAFAEQGVKAQTSFLRNIFCWTMPPYSPEDLGSLITGDGLLGESDIQEVIYLVGNECPRLTVLCANLIGENDNNELKDSYFTSLCEKLDSSDGQDASDIVRELQTLFPERKEEIQGRVIDTLVQGIIASADNDNKKAQKISTLLSGDNISDETKVSIAEKISSTKILVCEPLYHRLLDVQNPQTKLTICGLLLEVANYGDVAFKTTLTCALVELEKQGLLGTENQENTYNLAIDILADGHNNEGIQAYAAQKIAEQKNYHAMRFLAYACARIPIWDVLCEDFPELAGYAENPISEINLLCEVLEDDDTKLGDYLRICAAFTEDETNGQVDVEHEDIQILPVLHALYHDQYEPRFWKALATRPTSKHPRAYAKMKQYAAILMEQKFLKNDGSSEITIPQVDSAWEDFFSFCWAEKINDLFFAAIKGWNRSLNLMYRISLPWYNARNLFYAIQSTMEEKSSDEVFASCPEDEATEILNKLVKTFKRICQANVNPRDDSNHVTLRTIMELAVKTNIENLFIELAFDDMTGSYLGVATTLVCRLLLEGKYQTASDFLKPYLEQTRSAIEYADMLNVLSTYSVEELRTWASDSANRRLLQFVLPNGNKPDVLRLQTFVMEGIQAVSPELHIKVIRKILKSYPNDPAAYSALFILCKEDYMSHIPDLLDALYGVYKNYPPNGRPQYTRSRDDILTDITVLRFIAEKIGLQDLPEESPVELIRGYNYQMRADDLAVSVEANSALLADLQSRFIGVLQGTADYELRVHCLMAFITMNFNPYIQLAYKHNAQNYLTDYWPGRTDIPQLHGILRGALRAWKEQPTQEEQQKFTSWLNNPGNNVLGIIKKANGKRPQQIRRSVVGTNFSRIVKNYANSVNWDILYLPWEEHMVSLGNLKDLNRPEINSCYKVMDAMCPKDHGALPFIFVSILLSQDALKAQLFTGNAGKLFEEGKYDYAGAMYEALLWSHMNPQKTPYFVESTMQLAYFSEVYLSWKRICYIFAGSNSESISEHSWVNIIISLANAGQIKDLNRLRPALAYIQGRGSYAANRYTVKLFNTIQSVLADELSEDEILKAADEMGTEPVGRRAELAFLSFLVLTSNTGIGSYFVRSPSVLQQLSARLTAAQANMDKYNETRNNKSKKEEKSADKYYLRFVSKPNPSLIPPIPQEVEEEEAEPAQQQESESKVIDFTPSYIKEVLTKIPSKQEKQSESIESLQDQHDSISNFQDSDRTRRLGIAAQIYRQTDQNGQNSTAVQQATIQLGIDYYLHCMALANQEGDTDAASKAQDVMMELAKYGSRSTVSTAVGLPSYMAEWLSRRIRGFSAIRTLLEDYGNNAAGYSHILEIMLGTGSYSQVSTIILSLDLLLETANRHGEIDVLSLQSAQRSLNSMETPTSTETTRIWRPLKDHMLELTRKAINEANQRPSLKVTIINDSDIANGHLFGQIENTGEEPAFALTLQATYPSNPEESASSIYRFQELYPQGIATFAITYTCKEDMDELEYILTLNYEDGEKKKYTETQNAFLQITPVPDLPTEIPRFNTEKACSFYINENGELASNDFRGRKSELSKILSLVKKDRFEDIDSAIMQGIKRSGKSSLLNYLDTYLNTYRSEDTLVVQSDAQVSGSTSQCVYKTFFEPMLVTLPVNYPWIAKIEGWDDFVNKWSRADSEPDRDPADMALFYRELHALLVDKGVFLIVDEFDFLLERMNELRTSEEGLLRSLRNLQMDQNCFSAIHLVICGSNNLLAYNQTGSFTNQMFQSYREIKVGQMLTEDIRDMLEELLNPETGIQLDPQGYSLRWIERYTGGLVWYTRLLTNKIIENVLVKGKRNVIYPSDVNTAFDSICNFLLCRQFSEGCRQPQDIIVLTAICEETERYGQYVSIDQITKKLEGTYNAQQVAQSFAILTNSLDLLEQKAPNSKYYRFRVEIYRRFFRQQYLPSTINTLGDTFIEELNGEVAQKIKLKIMQF